MESMFASAMSGSVVRSSNLGSFYQPCVIDTRKKGQPLRFKDLGKPSVFLGNIVFFYVF